MPDLPREEYCLLRQRIGMLLAEPMIGVPLARPMPISDLSEVREFLTTMD